MGEFELKLRTKEAIKENTLTLIEEVKKGEVDLDHLLELEELANEEEEYEVAVSIRDVIKMIESGELKLNKG